MPTLDPDKLKIGYVILIATRKFAVEKLQTKAGFGESSKWTHIAGSLGGNEAQALLKLCIQEAQPPCHKRIKVSITTIPFVARRADEHILKTDFFTCHRYLKRRRSPAVGGASCAGPALHYH